MSDTKVKVTQAMRDFCFNLEHKVEELNNKMVNSILRHRDTIGHMDKKDAKEYDNIENSIEAIRCDITSLTTVFNKFKIQIENLYYNIESSKRNMSNVLEDNKCLKIMAYNVNGLKTPDADVCQFIKNNADIFILIKTHSAQNEYNFYSQIFDEFNISLQYRTQTSERARGVILCGVRKNLIEHGFHHEFKSYLDKTFVVVKIDNFEFTIIPIYLPQSNWKNEFQLYGHLLNSADIKNPILMGDFNVSIGQDQQNCLKQVYYAVRKERKSEDYISEINAEFFLNFLKKYQLTLLNGRTMGDTDGKSTKSNSNVKSVTEYCCVHSDMVAFVDNFLVTNSVQQFSDNLPIILGLKLNDRIIADARRSRIFDDA